MEGTIPQKISRLVTNLALHPSYIPRYVKHNVVSRRTPLDHRVPWLSYGVIDFLENYLRKDMEVFEWGSGGSTLFIASRVKSVVAIENDPSWVKLVDSRLESEGVRNVQVELHAFDFWKDTNFEQSSYLCAVDRGRFDVILVDGMEGADVVRPMCFERAENQIKPGGIIVIDDSWRYPGLRKKNRAKEFREFRSVGPCRPGVTSTDVYFY